MVIAYQPEHTWDDEFVTDELLQRIEDNIAHLKQRSDRQITYGEETDASAEVGDVLVATNLGTDNVTLSSIEGQAGPFAIALEPMTAGNTGQWVRWAGTANVNVVGVVNVANWLKTSATKGKAEMCDPDDPAAFAFAVSGNPDPSGQVAAVLVNRGGGGGGVFSTSTDGLVPGPSGSEDDSSHVLAGDGTWLDTSALGGSGASGAIFDPPPLYAAWTALNTGTLVVTDHAAGLVFDWPATASPGTHLRGVEEAISGTWARYARIDDVRPLASSNMVGLMIRQVGAGSHQNNVVAFTFTAGAGTHTNTLQVDIWTDVNTYSANSYVTEIALRSPAWLCIRNDGTNIFFELSQDDGQTYLTIQSFGTTAQFNAVDRIGVVVSPFNSNVAIHATLRSWGTAPPALA